MNGMNNCNDDQVECPLCMEQLEVDDLNFYPCTCGYQVCFSFLILFFYLFLIFDFFVYRFVVSAGTEFERTKTSYVLLVVRHIPKIRRILRLYLKSK